MVGGPWEVCDVAVGEPLARCRDERGGGVGGGEAPPVRMQRLGHLGEEGF